MNHCTDVPLNIMKRFLGENNNILMHAHVFRRNNSVYSTTTVELKRGPNFNFINTLQFNTRNSYDVYLFFEILIIVEVIIGRQGLSVGVFRLIWNTLKCQKKTSH